MIYTITLNPALDLIMDYKNEKTIQKWARTDKTSFVAGGKGINASNLLNELGVKNEAIILSGGNVGNLLERKLQQQKINYKNFDTLNDTRINVKVTFDDTYEFLSNSVNNNANVVNELLHYLDAVLKANDIVMIMGSKMKNIPDDAIDKISDLVVKKNAKIIYDISDKELLKLLKYKPLLIKPNVKEILEIFSLDNQVEINIDDFALKLIEMGAQHVIVSNAEKGAKLFTEDQTYLTAPIKINFVNGSGAGDSMSAGFVYKYINEPNDGLQEMLDFANACGAATASSYGIASKEKVFEIWNKIKKEKNDK